MSIHEEAYITKIPWGYGLYATSSFGWSTQYYPHPDLGLLLNLLFPLLPSVMLLGASLWILPLLAYHGWSRTLLALGCGPFRSVNPLHYTHFAQYQRRRSRHGVGRRFVGRLRRLHTCQSWHARRSFSDSLIWKRTIFTTLKEMVVPFIMVLVSWVLKCDSNFIRFGLSDSHGVVYLRNLINISGIQSGRVTFSFLMHGMFFPSGKVYGFFLEI